MLYSEVRAWTECDDYVKEDAPSCMASTSGSWQWVKRD